MNLVNGLNMSDLTVILKGIARLNHEKSGLPKKALPLFEKSIKNLYYSATDTQKDEMKRGFE